MTRPLVLLVLVLAAAGGCASRAPLTAVPVERQVLVVFDDHQAGEPPATGSKRSYRQNGTWPVSLHVRAFARRLARDHGLQELHAWPIPELGLYCVVFGVPETSSPKRLIHLLGADRRVMRAQPVNVFAPMLTRVGAKVAAPGSAGESTRTYDDPLFAEQYGDHRQVLQSVHALTTGRGVRIAIIDGPVDTAHEDLRGQIARQFPPEDGADVAMLRHGTAVAGVIAAAAGNGEGVVGLAPDATVSVYAACRRIEDQVTRCTSVSLAEAIERAMTDGVDILNLSLAGPEDWLLERLLRHAHEGGAVVIAAYNEQDPSRRFPASLPFVHAVSPDATAWFARSEQFSTRAGGGYQVFFGSSMSAAGVTGMAALLRAEWTAPETERILTRLLGSGCTLTTADARLHAVRVAHEDEDCAR